MLDERDLMKRWGLDSIQSVIRKLDALDVPYYRNVSGVMVDAAHLNLPAGDD